MRGNITPITFITWTEEYSVETNLAPRVARSSAAMISTFNDLHQYWLNSDMGNLVQKEHGFQNMDK